MRQVYTRAENWCRCDELRELRILWMVMDRTRKSFVLSDAMANAFDILQAHA